MGQTLRRSCAACAKSKLSCDLRTPRCSRCVKRNAGCVYANEPLTGSLPAAAPVKWQPDVTTTTATPPAGALTLYRPGALDTDPFDSYPKTRLPREHVQRLIHTFLHKIAFQYYPLDLSAVSNPFLVSWWPLALGDPALFHVSLQTACLDEELLARKGFMLSELLMADSVALVRRKVEDTALAIQDGTMNSVITLAAIETNFKFGKGNVDIGEMHVDGVKKLVDIRGGINAVRQTSPLTARMVSWVSMLVKRSPQFSAQDDSSTGTGIPPPPEWTSSPPPDAHPLAPMPPLDPVTATVFLRLRAIAALTATTPLPPTRLHDLASFVLHRLLASPPPTASPTANAMRHALAAYMFALQGPTYYSHAVILQDVIDRLVFALEQRDAAPAREACCSALDVWLHAVGLVGSAGTTWYAWFAARTPGVVRGLGLGLGLGTRGWGDLFAMVKSVVWIETSGGEGVWRRHWEGEMG